MLYTRQAGQLTGDRRTSACALLKGKDGETLVAIAGGPTPGMETWNPVDGSVKTLTTDFPSGTGFGRQMISVKGGSELIVYEWNYGLTGIWKYTHYTSNWTKVGEMILSRNNFVVLPVDGMACP
jgi:hypothetical protein